MGKPRPLVSQKAPKSEENHPVMSLKEGEGKKVLSSQLSSKPCDAGGGGGRRAGGVKAP